MGSVSDDYQCPWCGRKGMDGYPLDGMGYPLCAVGKHNCVSTSANKYSKQSEYFTDALLLRFGMQLPPQSRDSGSSGNYTRYNIQHWPPAQKRHIAWLGEVLSCKRIDIQDENCKYGLSSFPLVTITAALMCTLEACCYRILRVNGNPTAGM